VTISTADDTNSTKQLDSELDSDFYSNVDMEMVDDVDAPGGVDLDGNVDMESDSDDEVEQD
jgi:hypothetical protein